MMLSVRAEDRVPVFAFKVAGHMVTDDFRAIVQGGGEPYGGETHLLRPVRLGPFLRKPDQVTHGSSGGRVLVVGVEVISDGKVNEVDSEPDSRFSQCREYVDGYSVHRVYGCGFLCFDH